MSDMQRLWTPWRMEYIKSAAAEEDDEPSGCIFCELPEAGDDRAALILHRTEHAFVMLNKFPYNPGHLMVAPFPHVGRLEDMDDEAFDDLHRLLRRAVAVLREEGDPHGFNIGMNIGRVAGAGIPDHLHWHAVPRWRGDHNFMPVIGQTKVLPELLEETYDRLRPRFG